MHERGVRDRVCPASGLPQAPGVRGVALHGLDAPLLQLPGRLVGARGAGDPVAGGDQSVAILEPVYPVAPVTSTSIPLLPAAPSDAGAYHGSG